MKKDKEDVSFKKINGIVVPKLRGGRTSKIHKDVKKYTRKNNKNIYLD